MGFWQGIDYEAYFPRVLRRDRGLNNRMVIRHLLEDAVDENQRLREFWNEVHLERDEKTWEESWIPAR